MTMVEIKLFSAAFFVSQSSYSKCQWYLPWGLGPVSAEVSPFDTTLNLGARVFSSLVILAFIFRMRIV